MSKRATVHFLTAYVEYLLDQGIRSEESYLGDASRFLRYLLEKTTAEEIEAYICSAHHSPAYRSRLEKTLRKFFNFARERLAIETELLLIRKKEPEKSGSKAQGWSGRHDLNVRPSRPERDALPN